MNSGKVVALHLKPRPGELDSVDTLTAVAGKGFEGDRCFGQGTRQALLISTESLDLFGYQPGELREQVTVDLGGLQSLAPGTRIQAGQCLFVLEGDCAPCDGMARRLKEEPSEFKAKVKGNRGMLARVAEGGTIQIGGEVRVLGA